MSNGRRQKTDGEERDWTSKHSRRMLRWKPGAGKKLKRRMNKRERRRDKD